MRKKFPPREGGRKRNRSSEPEAGLITVGDETVAFSVTRSRKRKRTVAFKVEFDASLRVLAPVSASLGALTRILQKRGAWIVRAIAARRLSARDAFADGADFFYLGHRYVLRVTQGGDAPRSCLLSPRVLRVHVPDEKLSPENLRQEARLEIRLWLKKRARIKLKKRLDLWAEKMDVAYKKLIVTDPERRWGSCSVDNVIRLNWRLMLAPLPVIDYVVAHELAHIRHKNHSPRFWAFLAQAMPDCQARRKILRGIERRLVL